MFVFPVHLLPPGRVRRYRQVVTLSGGRSLVDDEDVIEADGGGRWVVEYDQIELVDARQARVWDAWSEYLQGGTTECLVPLISWATGPRSSLGNAPKIPSPLFYDNEEWPTVLRYALPEHAATIVTSAPLRATSVRLAVTKGPAPRGGEHFSFNGRAHRILRATAPGVYSIVPPLRADVAAPQPVVFDFPLLRAKAVPRQSLAPSYSQGRQHGVASIQFAESV